MMERTVEQQERELEGEGQNPGSGNKCRTRADLLRVGCRGAVRSSVRSAARRSSLLASYQQVAIGTWRPECRYARGSISLWLCQVALALTRRFACACEKGLAAHG